MRQLTSLVLPALAVAFGLGTFARADEGPRPLAGVLAKWEAASRKCRSLDATVTRLRYDGVFSPNRPQIATGRFYYEAPNLGRFELADDDPHTAELWIWNQEEVLRLDPVARVWHRMRRPSSGTTNGPHAAKPVEHKVNSRTPSSQQSHPSWGAWLFGGMIAELLRITTGPQGAIPLTVDIRTAAIQEQFDVTLDPRRDEIRLKAVPKIDELRCLYRQVEVIIDGRTYQTSAIRLLALNGKDSIVFQLADVKVNEVPKDRDELLKPHFGFGYTVKDDEPLALLPEH